jgi:hypothetical protein
MTEKIQLTGLCINCLSAEDCGYRINNTKPIIFCEEFSYDDCGYQENHTEPVIFHYRPSTPKPSGVEDKIIRVRSKVKNSYKSLPKGICCNCENLATCTLQKTDDPVMNCEEYK